MSQSTALTVQATPTHQMDLMPSPEMWGTMMQMAGAFLKSGLLPQEVNTPEKAVLLLQKARELSLPPTVALAEIVIIKGKPSCSAQLLRTLAYRDHGDEAFRVEESTPARCVVSCKRRGWKDRQRFVFTMEDAQRAKLGGDNWAKYPAAMLLARNSAQAIRACFPDSIAGMYLPDELGADVVVDGDDIRLAPVQVQQPAPTPLRSVQVEEELPALEETPPPAQHQLDTIKRLCELLRIFHGQNATQPIRDEKHARERITVLVQLLKQPVPDPLLPASEEQYAMVEQRAEAVHEAGGKTDFLPASMTRAQAWEMHRKLTNQLRELTGEVSA